jgi:hypothetical protein
MGAKHLDENNNEVLEKLENVHLNLNAVTNK